MSGVSNLRLRHSVFVIHSVSVLLAAITACGGGSSTSGGSGSGGSGGGGGSTTSNVPILKAISPSIAIVRDQPIQLVAYGSNFGNSVTIQWNGVTVPTTCVGTSVAVQVDCPSAGALAAIVPASLLGSPGIAKVTVANFGGPGLISGSLDFTLTPKTAGITRVRAIAGISAPWDELWDASRGKLYVATAPADAVNPDRIVAIDPLSGSLSTVVSQAGDVRILSPSSDSSYLWTDSYTNNSVQRFLLPNFAKDISFTVPLDRLGKHQWAISLEAAPVNPHTIALVAGNYGSSWPGNGVYVYDDATPRPASLSGAFASSLANPEIDWLQWGDDDSILFGTRPDTGSWIYPIQVNSSGVSLGNERGNLNAGKIKYDRKKRLAYTLNGSGGLIGAFDARLNSQVGEFDVPTYVQIACTADSNLGRYYCLAEYTPPPYTFANDEVELWVYDLNSYALLNRINFGYLSQASGATQPFSSITGAVRKLVRWGNSGLALITTSGIESGLTPGQLGVGPGGLFLIDGPAINPSSTTDAVSGPVPSSITPVDIAWVNSIAPQSAPTGSGDVMLTIKGNGFGKYSIACENCVGSGQQKFLPTTYVSSTQLTAIIPASDMASPASIAINVCETDSPFCANNALTFTVLPASNTTQITPLNLAGISMAWDAGSQLLYVGTLDMDSAHPNSIVAVSGALGTIARTQTVNSVPIVLSTSAGGQYLYAGFAGTSTMSQFSLPSLTLTSTWTLRKPNSQDPAWMGDMAAAPVSPHTTATTLFGYSRTSEDGGQIAIYDDDVQRPVGLIGSYAGTEFDYLAWGDTDSILTSAGNTAQGCLYTLAVDVSGVTNTGQGCGINTGGAEIHSDRGTGLVYSDDGIAASPVTGTIVGDYKASGLLVPDSSLNRVFILGQTSAQARTKNYTIQSFDQKGFTPVSSLVLSNIYGTPIQLARWGTSGLAVLTLGGDPLAGYAQGMLYLAQDSSFVSASTRPSSATSAAVENVQVNWKRRTRINTLALLQKKAAVLP